MMFSPVEDHPDLYPVVLRAPVAANTAWPPEHSNSGHEEGLHCGSALVAAAMQVYDDPRVAVDTAMNVEAPRAELLVPILVP
jgi:hypothetical protein